MQGTGRNIVVVILLFVVFVMLFGIICFVAMMRLLKQRKALLLRQHRLQNQSREELLRAVLEMQEHTFRSVSNEIHDNVGQLLSLAKLHINILLLEQEKNEKLLLIKEYVSKSIHALRNLGNTYHADTLLDTGLLSAIGHQVTALQRTGMYTVSFRTNTDTIIISKSAAILLYRVIQESFTNIIKHADASLIDVAVMQAGNDISIIIADNGKGFNNDPVRLQKGIGLRSMQQRVQMAGARLEIASRENRGTVITIFLNDTI